MQAFSKMFDKKVNFKFYRPNIKATTLGIAGTTIFLFFFREYRLRENERLIQ